MHRASRFAVRYLTAAGGAAYLLSLGLRSPRHRAMVARLAEHFGVDGRVPARLPVVDIGELVDESRPVVVRAVRSVDGNVTAEELVALCQLVAHHRPQALFEIGTFDGRTTLNLAANAPAGACVHTLDLPASEPTALALAPGERQFVDKPRSGARFAQSDLAGRIVQLYGDSATFDFAPYAADFVFVDGSHAYDYVLSDSRRALALLPGGRGVVVWHDYGCWDGVTRALDELQAGEPAFAGLRRVAGTTLAVLVAG